MTVASPPFRMERRARSSVVRTGALRPAWPRSFRVKLSVRTPRSPAGVGGRPFAFTVRPTMLLVIRFLFQTLLTGLVTKGLGKFFPIVRRFLALIWR